ncbi:GntR family transcriptional regulator [Anaerotruncus sp. 80]|uniref:GntR family transcriptional regulator n=1 Tax=Anaerotruncus colihominis TaxID=169435 RepID=A0A845QFI5_9FIRM|nr:MULTISPECIES: GntR family transcriptional regulator [Clostridia]NBH60369.1 GntR family transcriptional regulator [Anaerotruncus colihominis]NCE99291.1 GntR family transcriptional regulator [Emergencia sp. 1XD21-10]NCF01023.1 GntR family transcriptional regulator [Anaerotruncus sp. 80]
MIEYKTISLANQVYDRLEYNILSGTYAPGEIISETRLSEELGVSRTPIREAMAKLAHEKLIKDSPQGTVVVGVTENDVKDLFEVKRRIEIIATRRAAENISEEGLAALKENVEQQEFFAQKGDVIKVRDLDTEFHDILYRECGSVTFETILSPIHHKMMKFRRLSLEKSHRIVASVAEHKSLYNAIADKDGDKIETIMLLHIDHAYNNIMEVNEQYGTDNSTEDH